MSPPLSFQATAFLRLRVLILSVLFLCLGSGAYAAKVATPSFSPVAGTYTTFQSVTITSTSGATIYYTTDGSTPTTSSSVYLSPVPVNASATLKDFATKSGSTNSNVGSATYTINADTAAPQFSPGEGYYATPQDVSLSSATSIASIRYTTDGSTPTSSYGTLYAGTPVTIAPGTTLKAIAYATNMNPSAVASRVPPTAPPTPAPPSRSPPAPRLRPSPTSARSQTGPAAQNFTTPFGC